MGEITSYPEFVPNQVLTNTQLNQLRAYLDREDRASRVRLFGTGIVCGLHWTLGEGDKELRLACGFGISSAGYLVGLGGPSLDENGAGETGAESGTWVFTHGRTYRDPDVEPETGAARYRPWRQADGKRNIIELLDAAAVKKAKQAGAAADDEPKELTGDDLKGRVVVIYLEREPVKLNSCLVTDCDNKGLNIKLTPRVLLIRAEDLDKVRECGAAPELLVLPRTHLETSEILDAAHINGAYFRIVEEAAKALAAKVSIALERYEVFLGLEQRYGGAGKKAAKLILKKLLTKPTTQYHYDAAKDFACAYNEFVTEACALMTECGSDNGFPRHLLLGALDAGVAGYRREFTPSPMKNVVADALRRVRSLFARIVAMAESLDLGRAPKGDILIPSHDETKPLGMRALPHYFPRQALADLWQPRLCCTTQPLWAGENAPQTAGLGYQYPYCSFIRAEGHLGLYWNEAAAAIGGARREANAEFTLLHAYLSDPDPNEADRQEEIGKTEAERKEQFARIAKELAGYLETKESRPLDFVEEIAQETVSREQKLLAGSPKRCERELYCDLGALEADYEQLRSAILCALKELAGHLEKLCFAAGRIHPAGRALVRAAALHPHVLTVAFDRTAAAIAACRNHVSVKDIVEVIEKRRVVLQESRGLAAPLALWAAAAAARDNIDAFVRAYLPRRLCELEAPLTLVRHKELASDLRRVFLLCALLEFVMEDDGAGHSALAYPGAPGTFEWRDAVNALGRTLESCAEVHLATLAARYDAARSNDLSLLGNLVKWAPGLEHTAGVGKGGVFVMACDEKGTVVADFSLAAAPSRCCRIDAEAVCLPPVARADYRIALLQPCKNQEGYEGLKLEIDVLANDHDPSSRRQPGDGAADLKLMLQGRFSELSATVELHDSDPGKVVYALSDPRPGTIDRFAYTIEGECGTDSAEVLILMIPVVGEEPGEITGVVYFKDSDQYMEGATVIIAETQATAKTNAKGMFAFEGVAPGNYTLTASFDDFTGVPVKLHVDAGATAKATLFVPRKRLGALVVLVRSAKTPQPILNADVALIAAAAAGSPKMLKTAKDGVASFRDLVPGGFTLRVGASGYGEFSEDLQIQAEEELEKVVQLQLLREAGPISREVIDFIAGQAHVTKDEAMRMASEAFESRYLDRLAVINGAELPEDSTALAVGVQMVIETYTDPAPTEAGTIEAYKRFSDAFEPEFAAATASQNAAYRLLLSAVSQACLDRLAMARPENVSATGKKMLVGLGKSIASARLKPAAFRKGWDGDALAAQLHLGAAAAISEGLK